MKTIQVIIADDHPFIREGLRAALSETSAYRVVGEAKNGREAVRLAGRFKSAIIIMDINLPLMDGLEAARIILKKSPRAKILIFSMHDQREYILAALECGAKGYVLKDAGPDELMKALSGVAAGGTCFCSAATKALASGRTEKRKRAARPQVRRRRR